MILILRQVLNAEQIRAVKVLVERGQFVSGKDTAGWHAQEVKHNLQWVGNDALQQQLDMSMVQALSSHNEFSAATYAKKILPFIISKSENSGGYGDHIDDALMHDQELVRTDISCTTFLSEPDSYQGGELVMTLGGAELSYKLSAGDAIIYPSTTLHRVNPVTQGSRLAALTWIESYVASAAKRELLYDLDCARKEIMQSQGKTKAFDLVTKSHANMLRRWAQS